MTTKRYSAGITSQPNVQPGAAYAEMVGSLSQTLAVKEIRLVGGSADGGVNVAIVKSANIGTAIGTGIALAASHYIGPSYSVPTSTAKLVTRWTATGAPTGVGARLRDDYLVAGTGIARDLWREEDGDIVIDPGYSLLLMNSGSGVYTGAMYMNITWDEGP